MAIDRLKSRLSDVPGIESLTLTHVGGRHVYGFDGLIAGVDPSSTEEQVIAAIRKAVDLRTRRIDGAGLAAVAGALDLPPLPQPKATTMSTPAPGSFAASLRAIVDEARNGVDQAKAEGIARVREAVGELGKARDATVRVTDRMVENIQDQAASVMSELGQISNDLTGES